jgi:hypothetical protein
MPYTEEEHQVYDIEGKEVNAKPAVSMPKAISHANAPNLNDNGQPIPQDDLPEKVSPTQNSQEKQGIVEEPAKPKELSLELKHIEDLAIKAFKGSKQKWLEYLGSKFGCESLEQLTAEQRPKLQQQLEAIIKTQKE